jgi:hypothetical protein
MLSGRWLGVRSPADKSVPAPHGSGEWQDDHRFVDFRTCALLWLFCKNLYGFLISWIPE